MVINTWENVAYKHLPNSAKQGYSWEAHSNLGGQKILTFMKPKGSLPFSK
jgi:hypothetical protein